MTMIVEENKPFLAPTPAQTQTVMFMTKEDEEKPEEVRVNLLPPEFDNPLVQMEEDGVQTEQSPELNPWELPEISLDEGPRWKDLDHCARVRLVLVGYIGKLVALLGLLYVFICSLGLLSDAFRLLGGRAAGEIFKDSKLLQNPICGLMLGVLATVLLQSSSTSTSIVVSMVSSARQGLLLLVVPIGKGGDGVVGEYRREPCRLSVLEVRMAIPIVMGANIGTSMTNTLVSVAHSSKRAEFRRAFAGATVHDMFNWLCVIILLPLEIASGYLFEVSNYAVNHLNLQTKGGKEPKLLTTLTDPFTKSIIQLDKAKIKGLALGALNDTDDFSLIKRICDKRNITSEMTWNSSFEFKKCGHLFAESGMRDSYVGAILLVAALVTLITCLILIVKILNSLLKGKIAAAIRKTINNDFPAPFGFLTGYAAIALGAVMTILVQSSSVFTSTLTPLVGIGILSLERMYPLTLGSNVGTTFTSVLAAMASPPDHLKNALQIAFCHLFFNISGIIIFYPIPFMRKAPIGLAKILGNKTAKYRWVAILYIAVMFFLLPGAIFGLSMAGPAILLGVTLPLAILFAGVTIVNMLQSNCPKCLPNCLRSWAFLPRWLHSLKPIDGLIDRIGDWIQSCCPFCTWTMCFDSPDTAATVPPIGSHESRKNLLLATSPGNSAFPSRAPTRSNSPTRGGRGNKRRDERTPL